MSTNSDLRPGRDTWLLAVDGSRGADDAARYVARTASALGVGMIHLVNARLPSVAAESRKMAAQRAQALQEAERTTATARRILDSAGLRYRLQAPIGDDPAAMIVGAAENADATEIVMGTRGVSMLSSITLGSVAYKVVHMARRSVTLVPDRVRSAQSGGKRDPFALLVAVDGSNVAQGALRYAAGQARANARVRIVLLNVQPRIVSQNVRRFVSKKQIDDYYAEQVAAVLGKSRRILHAAGIQFGERIAVGEPVEAIIATAAESECGRILIGTRGRGAAKSLLLGSVAYGVVHHADVPVTIVKKPMPAPVVLGETRTQRY